MGLFFTSDLHIGHSMLAELRGFDSVAEHDAVVLANLRKIGKGHDIFILGDIVFGPDKVGGIARILESLAGNKVHLILGNHDRGHPCNPNGYRHLGLYEGFTSVQTAAQVRGMMLSHFPYNGDHTREQRFDQWRLRDCGLTLLHGHTHSCEKVSYSPSTTTLLHGHAHSCEKVSYRPSTTVQVNVALEAWDMRPASLGDVQALLASTEKDGNRRIPDRSHGRLGVIL